jgi:CheY-like chemotaxis protein
MPDEKKLDPQVLKERIGKHLRTADELTRSGHFDDAIIEIQQALEIDPKNNYARSFLERVKLMNKRSQKKETEQIISEEISFEERMTLISQYLSTAESYINKRDYKHALEEVARVYKIDPKNYYAQTYSERIETLMLEGEAEETAKRRAEEAARRREEEAAERKEEEAAEKAAEESKNKEAEEAAKRKEKAVERIAKESKNKEAEEAAKRKEEAVDKTAKESKNKEAEEAAEESEIKETAEAIKKQIEETVSSIPKAQPIQQKAKDTVQPERGSTLMYRELLKDFWFDGKVTEEEALELSTMRTLFGITKEEHVRLEREIKIESYVEALRIAWRDNILSDTEQKTLQMMHEKYGISSEEQTIAEARYDEIRRSSKTRTVILIVDPDRENLVLLNKLLKQRGFIVFMAQKVEDALQILNTQTPNCIISEVLFPKGQIDGTEFLKKIREHPTLKHLAFFFISSINDKKVISASYRLGTDHFLIKPVDTDALLALIEGKIHISL